MFCSYCGQPLVEDMAFCVRCGRPVEKPEEVALPLEFEDAPDTTGPLPRLDEDGNPVAVEVAAVEGGEGGEGGEAAASSPTQAQKLAALVKPAGPRPIAADAPVVRVHKSRVPMIVAFVLVAVVIGCVCFVGGMYAVTQGILGPDLQPASQPADQQPAQDAEPAADEAPGAGAAAGADADADASGCATADEVAQTVQEGWEALIAEGFSEDAQRTWTETVLTLQPAGVLEALAALVGVDGDSLLPLYLYDGAAVQSQLPVEEFLNGQQAAVAVDQTLADRNDLAELNVYFGDLGQTVAGQVQKVELPFDVAEAYRLTMEVSPLAEGDEAPEDTLTVNEGALSYVAYRYEGRWYLFAPQLQKADVRSTDIEGETASDTPDAPDAQ